MKSIKQIEKEAETKGGWLWLSVRSRTSLEIRNILRGILWAFIIFDVLVFSLIIALFELRYIQ